MVPDTDSTQLQAIDSLPADVTLLKMENEQIFAVARAQPRDPMKIVKQLQELIDAYPAAADDAIYVKPVGTMIEVTCGQCGVRYEVTAIDKGTACVACDSTKIKSSRKVKRFAEGLSIRAAESIRSIYGYTRLATTTEVLEDGKVKLTGTLVDYAAGNITSDERIVTPWYKSRGGGMVRTPDDRFLNVVVKAEKAKLRRDVILDNTPNIVKAMFRDACEKKLEALIPIELIDQKIVPAFAEFGVTREQLDQIVGRPATLGWRESERLRLRGILTALRDRETTVQELLDGLVTTASAAEAPAGSRSEALSAKLGVAPVPPPSAPAEKSKEQPPEEQSQETREPAPDAEEKELARSQRLDEYRQAIENMDRASDLVELGLQAKADLGLSADDAKRMQVAIDGKIAKLEQPAFPSLHGSHASRRRAKKNELFDNRPRAEG